MKQRQRCDVLSFVFNLGVKHSDSGNAFFFIDDRDTSNTLTWREKLVIWYEANSGKLLAVRH